MPEYKVHILCTRPVPEFMFSQAAKAGIHLDVISFIETEPLKTTEVQQEIENTLLQTSTVIFTSGSAVEAVAEELEGHAPDWEIFCLGNTTRQLVIKYFGEEKIAGFADNASDLAEIIIDSSNAKEAVFFCGNQRRHELPDTLRQNEIEVDEIVVYQTIGLPRKLNRSYDAILFFSPTAVTSFFESNSINEKSILFSIGNTTAAEIRKYTKNKIIISDEPDKEKVLEMALEYFT